MPSTSQSIEDPYKKIEDISLQLVEIIGAHQKDYPKNEKKYFAAISELLEGVVDFNYIAKKDQKIVLVDQKPLANGQRKLIINQEIRGSGNIFPLKYYMARKKTGEWMVINMTISGINLRDIFRNQFLQAAQKSKGDLDRVITGWTSNID